MNQHQCRRCRGPLVELLSDAAGRIFGCPFCRAIDPANVDRPADVLGVETLTRRQRRRAARQWTRGRRGARRVPKAHEVTRPREDRVMVLPIEAFQGNHLRDLGNGWAIGLLSSPQVSDWFRYFRFPGGAEVARLGSLPATAPVESITIRLKPVGGIAWGAVDDRCPESVWRPAFERLYQERVAKVAPAFFAMCEGYNA